MRVLPHPRHAQRREGLAQLQENVAHLKRLTGARAEQSSQPEGKQPLETRWLGGGHSILNLWEKPKHVLE